MPSTYTLNNGIELIATGEQSGTWGATTNTNLALIDTALDGQVTITLAAAGSSGSPNTLPISDGSASNGRNRLVIFDDGGDLGATAYVQLTPNDAEKIVYIRNDLSGSRSIILFQGTYNASNDYEVPAGTTAVVFFNGGGAGAVAANVFNNAFFDSLRLGSVSVTAILDEDNMASDSDTALATQQSIKAYVDAQVGANNELSEVLANGNTSGGTNIQMTTTDEVQFRDTALKISSSVDGQLDIDADVELEITAPTLDIDASTAVTIDTATFTVTGSANVVGDLDVDNLNLNGNAIISTNTNGNIALTPNGSGEVDITKVDIDGGTIDGTVIGGSSAAAITGTTGTFTGNFSVDGGTIKLDGNYPVGSNNVALGDGALDDGSLTGGFNTALGTEALSANTTGGLNTAVGYQSLSLNTTGQNNTAMGVESLENNTTAGDNSAFGLSSLRFNTTGANNTAVGSSALYSNTTASNNTAVGYQAGYSNTTGNAVGAFGAYALQSNTTGAFNYAFGNSALQLNTTGGNNTALGSQALLNNTTANNNTAVGYQAGYSNTTGTANNYFGAGAGYSCTTANNNTGMGNSALNLNTGSGNSAFGSAAMAVTTTGEGNSAFGQQSLRENTTGQANSAYGFQSLYSNTTASRNTAVGYQAGYSNTTGQYNIAFGHQAGYQATTGSNTFIGDSAGYSCTTGSGNTVVGTIGIGGSNPAGYALTTGDSNTFLGSTSGAAITTGSKNTIIGRYDGNTGGLDIRTSSNNIVLSDGDGNPRGIFDSSGNFLVGKTSSAFGTAGIEIDGNNDRIWVTRSGAEPLVLNRLTNDGNLLEFYKDGTTVGSIGTNGNLYIQGPSGTSGAEFSNNAVRPWKDGARVDATVDLGVSAGRFKDLYLSGGVYLGGTGAANLLDDYEEGTFTPTLAGGFSSAPTSYTYNSGTYTKIGRYVYFAFDLQASGATADGSALSIGGLPFANIGAGFGGATYSYQASFNTISTDIYHITFNSSEISVYDLNGNPRAGNAAGISINSRVILFGSYQTAS